MTQEIFTGQVELTVRGINPTLNRGGEIFMSDAGINTEATQPTRPVQVSGELPALPRAGGLSLEGLTPAQQIDAKRTIKLIEDLGFKPKEVTSKGRTEQTAQSVVENADLDSQDPVVLKRSRDLANKDELTGEEREELFSANADRISKAEALLKESLGRELTDAEKKAILKAHFVGLGEKGKDEENDSSVFNVSQEQLAEKARILKDAGFDKEQRREIIESGLAAANPPPPINPHTPGTREFYEFEINTKITDPIVGLAGRQPFGNQTLEDMRNALVGMQSTALAQGGTALTKEWLDSFAEELHTYVAKNPRAHLEGGELRRRILEISRDFDLMEGHGEVEREFMVKYDDLARRGNLPELQEHVRDFVARVNPSERGIPEPVLMRIIKSNDNEALEHLAFRIIGVPLQSETGDYNLGFYGGINIDAITNLIQTLSQSEVDANGQAINRSFRKAQLRNLSLIKEGVSKTHEANKFIMLHQLDNAVQVAASLLPEYMQMMEKTKGVGLMMRFLDSTFFERLSKDTYITGDAYKEIMGTQQNQQTGRVIVNQPNSLYEEFRQFVGTLNQHAGLRVNGLAELGGMEDWEIDLAFNLARNVFNVQNRSAEIASQGIVPSGARAYASAFIEGLMKVYNPGEWVMKRFKPGEQRGGVRWFERYMNAMQRRRHEEGYGHMNLSKIKGHEIRHFELPTVAGMRGYWSSWKATLGLLRNHDIEFQMQGALRNSDIYYEGKLIYQSGNQAQLPVGIGYLLDGGSHLQFDIPGSGKIEWGKIGDQAQADFYRSLFLKPTQPGGGGHGGHGAHSELRDEMQLALGTIYKVSLNPAGGHENLAKHRQLNAVKEEIRAAIWAKMAKDNPLAVLPYLHNLEYNDGRVVLADIYERPAWAALHRKLNIWHEVKLAMNSGEKDEFGNWITPPNLAFGLRDAINFVRANSGGQIDLTHDEDSILREIESEGASAAADMANVKFAFIPFANDVLFERADYEQPGPESFGRHYRDVANLNASTGALSEVMDNFGKIKDFHGMVEFIEKFTKGITAVHGVEAGWDKAVPAIEATIGMLRRGENLFKKDDEYPGEEKLTTGQRIKRWLKEQDEYDFILKKFKKPNSEAQLYYNNVEMMALDRGQTYEAMEDLLKAGAMGHSQEEEFKKRFGGKGGPKGIFGFITRMILEGVIRGSKGALLVGTTEITKRSFKGAVS